MRPDASHASPISLSSSGSSVAHTDDATTGASGGRSLKTKSSLGGPPVAVDEDRSERFLERDVGLAQCPAGTGRPTAPLSA